MKTTFGKGIGRLFGNRAAVMTAGTVGFLLGATGLVAAQQSNDDLTRIDASATAETSIDDSTTTTATATTDVTAVTVELTIPGPTDDRATAPRATVSTSANGSAVTNSSIDDDHDDNATSTTIDDDHDDNATSTTIDDDHDDNATSTSVQRALPAGFTETYRSSGGSITVNWSGTTFSISSIDPAAGFAAEIEDNSWDTVRVDFESDDGDSQRARIEVRLQDGAIRVRID